MQGMRKRMSHYDPSQLPQSQWRHPNAPIQTEWQQPPSQPLPQQPIFQQSFQSPQPPQPPKKKTRNNLWITIGAVALMLALLVVGIGVQNRSQPAKSMPSSSSAHQQLVTQVVRQPSPQPNLVKQAIGKPIVVDSIWTITVNGVKTNAGDPFSMPAAGNTFLVVDVTVKNTSTHFQDMSSGIQLVLKDSTGQQYRESITDFATPPDGSIKFGTFLRGQLAYEIPATAHTFSYYFQADASGTDLTEWALKV
jgi:Domain of unknown function (DUF4352)